MKKQSLDELELKIVSLLQKNGRMQYVKMAEILGVTEGTIRRRVSCLIKKGILEVTAICNPYEIGFDAPAFIGLDVERAHLVEAAKEIAKFPEVQYVAITTGPYDITIQVISPSNRELYALIMELSKIEGVKDTETHIVLEIHKQSWDLGEIVKKKRKGKET